MNKKKYIVRFSTQLAVWAESEEEAQDLAGEWCADADEFLMPHNMDVVAEEAKGKDAILEAINDKEDE